ncbi:hypothetical protein AVEN_197825-1 [Araneus ventricosus]|uniref:Uncharacterized protein n=1 Tax=Araneus ventricosus TaxID=182803 RepID=A0A4Y2ETV7_ARAVE|nr:hypothetical protein AVEN_197825-1 [Araneus ventricosus]
MARKYSTKLASRRWPVQGFSNILDSAAINDWVIYKEAFVVKIIKRRDYILNLADELRNNYVCYEKSTLSYFSPGQPTAQARNNIRSIDVVIKQLTFDVIPKSQFATLVQAK